MAVAGFQIMLFDQVRDDFRIGFGGELVAFFFEPALERKIIFDNAVMHNHDFPAAVAMRMGILFGGAAMGGPAGVSDTVSAIERLEADDFFEIAQLAFGAPNLQALAVAGDRDSSRVVAAILQPPQALDDDRDHFFLPHVSDNAAHG